MTMTIRPYEAKWPNAILTKCINDAEGNTEKAIKNLQAYAAPSSFLYFFSWTSIGTAFTPSDAEVSRQLLIRKNPHFDEININSPVYSQEIYVNTPDAVKLHGILMPGLYWTADSILKCTRN